MVALNLSLLLNGRDDIEVLGLIVVNSCALAPDMGCRLIGNALNVCNAVKGNNLVKKSLELWIASCTDKLACKTDAYYARMVDAFPAEIICIN